MHITVVGTGYVGLVTGTCFAEMGNQVACVDVNLEKIEKLKQGVIPIFEPGLDDLVIRNTNEGRLHFTTSLSESMKSSSIYFIAVGTPPGEDGSADLQYVLKVAQEIGENITGYSVIVNKSTVPVGTADLVAQTIRAEIDKRGVNVDFDVVSNPEFLKEGAAIDDFMKPDRIIVGTSSEQAEKILSELYAPFSRNHNKIILMDVRSAELTKYAANCMLATKISFMNEIANLAERLGADIEAVRKGIGSDPRIGYHFIYPGCGYGGSCFPKDVQALIHTSTSIGFDAKLLKAVESRNYEQKSVLFKKINRYFNGELDGKVIAVWGLAFKPNTDDMRDAPSRILIEQLWEAGAIVKAFDPESMNEARRIYGERQDFILTSNKYQALEGADSLVICTEWQQFRAPDFSEMQGILKELVIFDGRNLYDPQKMKEMGFAYYSIGRP